MALKTKATLGATNKAEGGVLRAGLREFTRTRISEAAMKLFRTSGFRSTTVEQIADLAGTTVPTFYRHFKSKDDLFGPLRDHLVAEGEQALMKLDKIDVRDLTAIRGWLDSYMVMYTRVHRLCEAYWEAIYINEDNAREVLSVGMSGVQIMRNIFNNIEPAAREQMKMNLSFMNIFIDRLIGVVAVEENSAQADKIMDHIAQLLWVILNNVAPEKIESNL